jgi:hypothetical protein
MPPVHRSCRFGQLAAIQMSLSKQGPSGTSDDLVCLPHWSDLKPAIQLSLVTRIPPSMFRQSLPGLSCRRCSINQNLAALCDRYCNQSASASFWYETNILGIVGYSISLVFVRDNSPWPPMYIMLSTIGAFRSYLQIWPVNRLSDADRPTRVALIYVAGAAIRARLRTSDVGLPFDQLCDTGYFWSLSAITRHGHLCI